MFSCTYGQIRNDVLDGILGREVSELRAASGDPSVEESSRTELKDLGECDKRTEHLRKAPCEVVVHESVDEAVHQKTRLLGTGEVHDVKEEEEGSEVVIEVKETNLLDSLAGPEKDGSINPLPDLGDSEGDRDSTEPIRDRNTVELLNISELAVLVHVIEGRSEGDERINTKRTIVDNRDFLESLSRLRFENREDYEYTKTVEDGRADGEDIGHPTINQDLLSGIRDSELETFRKSE